MQTLIEPASVLVTHQDTDKLQRESLMGWLRHSSHRLLMPTFRYGLEESKPIVARLLEKQVSQRIGAAMVGPRNLLIADRLALADFVFRDTKRRIATQTVAVWLAMPHEIDWTMGLYYAAWHAYLTIHSLTGFVAWQTNGLLPATTLRRMRERLLQDAVGVLTRLELIEFLKHIDSLAVEW